MKKINKEDLLTLIALTGILFLILCAIPGVNIVICALRVLAVAVLGWILSRNKAFLRRITAFVLCLAMIGAFVVPAYASVARSGLLSPYSEDSAGTDRLTYLRNTLASMVEAYGLYPEMTDGDLANVYFALDSAESKATWDNANILMEDAQELSAEEAAILRTETNAQVCLRFYNIVSQIVNSVPSVVAIVENTETHENLTMSESVAAATASWKITNTTVTATITPVVGKDSDGCNTYSAANSTLQMKTSVPAEIKITVTSGSAKINGQAISSNDSEKIYDLEANGTISIAIECKGDKKASGGVTFTYNYAPASAANISVSFMPVPNIPYTVNDSRVESESVSVSIDDTNMGVSVKAENSKYVLVGGTLVDSEGKETYIPAQGYKLLPQSEGTLTPKFVYDENGIAPFNIGGTDYWDLESALDAAESGSTIVQTDNYTVPAGEYTIPPNITLLIPFDDANTLITSDMATYLVASGDATNTGNVYRTLTMASGANITVNGAISVSAKQGTNSGYVTGTYGKIDMESGSSIVINENAFLYAWGFITGSGNVTIKNKGTVYEDFQVSSWRGGNCTTKMTDDAETANGQGVFPMSQYYIQNVEVPMKLEVGASEIGYFSATVNSSMTRGTPVPFIGSQSSMFIINGGHVIKDYDETTDRLIFEIYGDVTVSSMEMHIEGMMGIGNVDIDTADYAMPITNNMTIDMRSGNVSINQNLAILPGAQLIVRENAKCMMGTGYSMYVYDRDEWMCGPNVLGYAGNSTLKFLELPFAPGRINKRSEDDLVDAVIQIEGEFDASVGFIYTTAGGANICGRETGQITVKPGTGTYTRQAIQESNYVGEWVNIPVTPAKLLNSNGQYTETKEANGTYTYKSGFWHKPECDGTTTETVTTQPTCVNEGKKTVKCTCGIYNTEVNIPKSESHTWGSWQQTQAPTCTADGVNTRTCSVCGTPETQKIPATGHTPSETWETATYEKPLRKVCDLCGEVLEKRNSVKVGNVEYLTLREALDGNEAKKLPAVSNRGTITLLTDISYAQGEDPISQIVVIDRNGHEIDHIEAGKWAEKNNAGEVVATHTYDVYSPEGEDKVVVKQEPFTIAATNIAANDSLDLNFYIWEYDLEGNDDYYAVITKTFADGRNDVVERHNCTPDLKPDNYFGRKIKFQDISAKEMMDNVQITIYDVNGNPVSTTFTETIEKYALRTLAQQTTLANKELTTALVDMLNYGAAAQDYFSYNNTDATQKANANIGKLQEYATKDDVVDDSKVYFDQRSAGEYLTTTTVSAKNQIMLTFYYDQQYVNPVENSNLRAVVSYGTEFKKEISGSAFYHNKRYGWYGVDVTGIPIADGNQLVTCIIMDGDNTLSTSKDSITGFCVRNKSESDDVYRDMLKFVDSAYKYFCVQ